MSLVGQVYESQVTYNEPLFDPFTNSQKRYKVYIVIHETKFYMSTYIASKRQAFQKAVEHLRLGLTQIRTGRANAAILDTVRVDAYDQKMDIKGVASVNVPDAKTITIEPWDKALLKAIETAIQQSDLGINPVNDGVLIRLAMPQMTEESRKQIMKIVKERVEEARIAVRQIREKVREEIIKQEKDKEISEDGFVEIRVEREKEKFCLVYHVQCSIQKIMTFPFLLNVAYECPFPRLICSERYPPFYLLRAFDTS